MRIWPFTMLWTRWRTDRRDRAVDAAWQAQAREHQAARRRILDAAHRDDDRPGWTGPTRMLATGPLLTFGQERGYRRSGGRR
jgi:hypothetical protein